MSSHDTFTPSPPLSASQLAQPPGELDSVAGDASFVDALGIVHAADGRAIGCLSGDRHPSLPRFEYVFTTLRDQRGERDG